MSESPIFKSLNNTVPSQEFFKDLDNMLSLSDVELKKVLEIIKISKNHTSIYDAIKDVVKNESEIPKISSAVNFTYYFLLKLVQDSLTLDELLQDFSKIKLEQNQFNKIQQFFKTASELTDEVLNQDVNYTAINAVLPRFESSDICIDERLVHDGEGNVIRRIPLILCRFSTSYHNASKSEFILQMTLSEAEYIIQLLQTQVDMAKKIKMKNQ